MTAAGDILRDHGHTQTTDHADPRIILAIDAAIARHNATGDPWSANDLRDELPVTHGPLIGARIRAAAMRRPREMVHTGTYEKSSLRSTRSARIAVWRGVTT